MSKLLQKLLTPIVVASALAGMSSAQADTWAWNYSGTNSVTASGTLTTAGNAHSFEAITGITGQQNGVAITGLVPVIGLNNPSTNFNFNYDNLFQSSSPYFNNTWGMLFVLADNSKVNIYMENSAIHNYNYSSSPAESIGSFNVTAVPEPETFALLLAGLGLVGTITRRRQLKLAA